MLTLKNLVERASKDSRFRSDFVKSPESTARNAGVEVPEGTCIKIIEQQSNDVTLMLGRDCGIQAVDEVLRRAEADPALKRSLLANSKKVLEEATDERFPGDVNVIDSQPQTTYVFLRSNSAELADAELEAVSGGGRLMNALVNALCRNSTTSLSGNGGLTGFQVIDYSATSDVTTW